MEVNPLLAEPELRRRARMAGGLYLLTLVTAPVTLLLIPGMLFVRNDPAGTAARLREHEVLFRWSLALGVAESVLWLSVVFALYRLLHSIGPDLARIMLILGVLLPAPVGLAGDGLRIAALALAKGMPFVSAIPSAEREALGYLALHVEGQLGNIESVFWGLWLFPLASLIARPGLAPRWIGISLYVAGVGYIVSAFLTMLAPELSRAAGPVFLATGFGEVPVIIWLAWWGTRGSGERHAKAEGTGSTAS
jgi:hypothetical protein